VKVAKVLLLGQSQARKSRIPLPRYGIPASKQRANSKKFPEPGLWHTFLPGKCPTGAAIADSTLGWQGSYGGRDRPQATSTEREPMKLFKLTRKFRRDEDGAVTVDWVVLTAAIVGLGMAVLATVKSGSKTLASNISTGLGAITVDTTGN